MLVYSGTEVKCAVDSDLVLVWQQTSPSSCAGSVCSLQPRLVRSSRSQPAEQPAWLVWREEEKERRRVALLSNPHLTLHAFGSAGPGERLSRRSVSLVLQLVLLGVRVSCTVHRLDRLLNNKHRSLVKCSLITNTWRSRPPTLSPFTAPLSGVYVN